MNKGIVVTNWVCENWDNYDKEGNRINPIDVWFKENGYWGVKRYMDKRKAEKFISHLRLQGNNEADS